LRLCERGAREEGDEDEEERAREGGLFHTACQSGNYPWMLKLRRDAKRLPLTPQVYG
jgi:hypothetical protein